VSSKNDDSTPRQTVAGEAKSDSNHPKHGATDGIDMDGLLLNHPTVLHVRFGLDQLAAAIKSQVMAATLSSLIEETPGGDGLAQSVLDARGLVPANGPTFAVTKFGENLLLDNYGNHFQRFIDSARIRQGTDAALQKLDELRRRHFNPDRIEDVATDAAQAILTALDSLKSFGDHLRSLRHIDEALEYLMRMDDEQIQVSNRAKSELERRLRADATAPGHSDYGQEPRSALARLIHAVKRKPVKPDRRPSSSVEAELLRVSLRLAALEAEKAILGQIGDLLRVEAETDKGSLALLLDRRDTVLTAARKSERARDYGIAAGEMLLNSEELTRASIHYLWGEGGDTRLVTTLRSIYEAAHEGEDVLPASGGAITPDVLAELEEIVGQAVSDKLDGFTVTDAIVALHQYGNSDIQGRLRASFAATGSKGFLAPSYANYLDLQSFTSVCYAPSALPRSNVVMKRLLAGALEVIDNKVTPEPDNADAECLRLYCEYFSVPATALAFYDGAVYVFRHAMDDARFNPHPDIHR
jgi:hypothetical protein